MPCLASFAFSTWNRWRISFIAVRVLSYNSAQRPARMPDPYSRICPVSRDAYRVGTISSAARSFCIARVHVPLENLLLFHVEMRSSFKSLFLFLLFSSTSTLSLPPPLSLIFPNSTSLNGYSNESFSNLTARTGVICSKVHGSDLSVDSCNNAWEKIARTHNSQRFIPRKTNPEMVTSDDVLIPFRYLSDDGVCAIVRCPCCPLLCVISSRSDVSDLLGM